MISVVLSILKLSIFIIAGSSIISKNHANDPNYQQEYLRVRNASLRAVICQQHVHSRALIGQWLKTQCSYLLDSITALRNLGFSVIDVFDCTALHQQLHHSSALSNGTHAKISSALCSGVNYEMSYKLKTSETADLFLMIGNSFVPTVTDAQHSNLQMASALATRQKSNTRVYFHTGASHHMQLLVSEKKPLTLRESHTAIRNIGLYDNILFLSSRNMEQYSQLMNSLFSTSTAISSHSGHPTAASIPPRLIVLPSNQSKDLQLHLEQVVVDSFLGAPFLAFVRTKLNFLRSTTPLNHARHQKSEGVHFLGPAPADTNSKPADSLVALIIEPRIEGSFEFCVRNVLSHLGDEWLLHVHHSKMNAQYVKHVLHDLAPDRVKFVLLPEPFTGAGSYNQYVKSSEFWSTLHSQQVKHVLIFQSDTLMLNSKPSQKIGRFLKYSFIGAPWHLTKGAESADWLRAMQKKKMLLTGVGNGGFSLRNVSSMLYIARNHRSLNPQVNEDVFFLMYMHRYESLGMLLPPRQEAYQFAREIPCDDLDSGTDPLALHSAWVYVNQSEANRLLVKSMHSAR